MTKKPKITKTQLVRCVSFITLHSFKYNIKPETISDVFFCPFFLYKFPKLKTCCAIPLCSVVHFGRAYLANYNQIFRNTQNA